MLLGAKGFRGRLESPNGTVITLSKRPDVVITEVESGGQK